MKAINLVQRFYPNVTKVKDANKPLEVQVQQRDIEKSNIKDHKGCVFARACERQNGIDGAIVAIKSCYVIKGDTATRYEIPESLAREIIAFDREGHFEPGDYYIKNPAPTMRLRKPAMPLGKKHVDNTSKRPRTKVGPKFRATKSIRTFNNPR